LRETVTMLYGRGYLDKKKRWDLWFEGMNVDRNTASTTVRDISIFNAWAQVQWEFADKFRLLYRADTIDRDERTGLNARLDRTVYGINYKPSNPTIISLEAVRNEFENPTLRDSDTYIFRVGSMFGGI
jgi:hypothetical protein